MDELVHELEAILGWRPEETDKGSITDLNEFPDTLVEAARQLPFLLCNVFVRHYLSTDNWKFSANFIEDVIKQGEDKSNWRRGRILVPGFLTQTLLELNIKEIVAPLAPETNEVWYQLKPRLDLWKMGEYLTGAPAVLRPDLNYKYYPPDDVRDILIPDTELNQIVDLNIAVRRWIAANLAGIANKRNVLNAKDPLTLIKASFDIPVQISPDAMIAARGLIQELQVFPKDYKEVLGFQGPDIWYSD